MNIDILLVNAAVPKFSCCSCDHIDVYNLGNGKLYQALSLSGCAGRVPTTFVSAPPV